MEKPLTKFYLVVLLLSSLVWFSSFIVKNIEISKLLEFGTIEFSSSLTPENELSSYRALARYSIVSFVSYSIVITSAMLFVVTTNRSFKQEGWLLMSAILLFLFVPVEFLCFWYDWKIVGLTYWGNWPLEEFRKAFLRRITALAGLPFIAQLCYFTIPILVIFKPLKNKEGLHLKGGDHRA